MSGDLVTVENNAFLELLADDDKLNDKSSFEVDTPNATLCVRGTKFSVACDKTKNETIIEVFEGIVWAVGVFCTKLQI